MPRDQDPWFPFLSDKSPYQVHRVATSLWMLTWSVAVVVLGMFHPHITVVLIQNYSGCSSS
ncbi:hypothetical protein BDN72DRAFT_647733 [Pluteus cervinus]|uniref:Uncharacterized protein n=1 Tax=Pluteus cervinus TaxID=181527 RepID=A0ACD3A074_9AGAR|nr:hypothetical protein BDN72DRAFT_647733 [Pluteus cervinus]